MKKVSHFVKYFLEWRGNGYWLIWFIKKSHGKGNGKRKGAEYKSQSCSSRIWIAGFVFSLCPSFPFLLFYCPVVVLATFRTHLFINQRTE